MDKSEIEKYGDFRKAIAKELKRQLGAATKTGVDEIEVHLAEHNVKIPRGGLK